MSKKSILEQTLTDIKQIKESVQKNANIALKSTLKNDLEEIIKKGLNESFEDEDYIEDEMGDDEVSPDDISGDVSDDAVTSDFGTVSADDVGDIDLDIDSDLGDDVETIDLTGSEDDEVINQFNLMDPADEIEIVRTDDGIQINVKSTGDSDLEGFSGEMGTDDSDLDVPERPTRKMGIDKSGLDGISDDDEIELDIDDESDDEKTLEESEDIMFEIDLSQLDANEHEEPILGNKTGMSGTGNHDHEVGGNNSSNLDENDYTSEHNEPHDPSPLSRPGGHEVGDGTTGFNESKKYTKEKELRESLINTRKKLHKLISENNEKAKKINLFNKKVNEYKKLEGDYKKAITALKGQLKEVALYTSNLSYTISLLTEHSTTKEEKYEILKKFDSAKTLKESRDIFKNYQDLFVKSKGSADSNLDKLYESAKGSGSKTVIKETSAYKNPKLERMKQLISKI